MTEIKQLEGWLTVTEVAAMFGVSRQRLHKLALQHGLFKAEDMRYIGDKAALLVREDVARIAASHRAIQKKDREEALEASRKMKGLLTDGNL